MVSNGLLATVIAHLVWHDALASQAPWEYRMKAVDTKEGRDEFKRIRAGFMAQCSRECGNCGSVDDLEVHHIVPIICGGTNRYTNLAVLCGACHGAVHESKSRSCSALTKAGLERAKAEGKQLGRPVATGTRDQVQREKAAGMTQARAAAVLGLSTRTVKRYWNQEAAQ